MFYIETPDNAYIMSVVLSRHNVFIVAKAAPYCVCMCVCVLCCVPEYIPPLTTMNIKNDLWLHLSSRQTSVQRRVGGVVVSIQLNLWAQETGQTWSVYIPTVLNIIMPPVLSVSLHCVFPVWAKLHMCQNELTTPARNISPLAAAACELHSSCLLGFLKNNNNNLASSGATNRVFVVFFFFL